METGAARITAIGWIAQTISKHIVSKQSLPCRGKFIRIDKSPHLGIVVTTLEIIQPGLYVVGLAMKHYGTLYRNGFEVSMEPKDSMDTSNIALLF